VSNMSSSRFTAIRVDSTSLAGTRIAAIGSNATSPTQLSKNSHYPHPGSPCLLQARHSAFFSTP
jgi:hypothetical protein